MFSYSSSIKEQHSNEHCQKTVYVGHPFGFLSFDPKIMRALIYPVIALSSIYGLYICRLLNSIRDVADFLRPAGNERILLADHDDLRVFVNYLN